MLRWYQPPGAVRGPDPNPQSAVAAPMTPPAAIYTPSSTNLIAAPHSMTSVGLLPMTQGLGVPSTDPLPLDLDFPMGPRHFEPNEPSYLFPISPDSVFAPDAAARLYENDTQNLLFSPFPTLDQFTSTFIPPSNVGILPMAECFTSSLPSTSQKRAHLPAPAHGGRSKRRKLNKHLVE